MSITDTVERIKEHTKNISPGQPAELNGGHTFGDTVWQGDLGIRVACGVPEGYERVETPKDADRQLVPEGGGPGSHHRIESLDDVVLYRPNGWGQTETDLRGPCIVFRKPNAIVHEPGHAHPHGTVRIAEPMTVVCVYQRNLDAEQRERRAAD